MHVEREISGVDVVEGHGHITNLHEVNKGEYVGVVAGEIQGGLVGGDGGVW